MSSSQPKLAVSVVIPIEPGALTQLALVQRQVREQLEKLGLDYEILYVLGGPTRALVDEVRALHGEDRTRVRVLRSGYAMGGGALLAAGFVQARGDLLLTLSPLPEVDLAILPQLLAELEAGADVAFASRNSEAGSGSFARSQSRLFNRMASWATGVPFRDIASGTRVLRREVTTRLPLYGDFHRYLPALAERLGFRVREVPAQRAPRPGCERRVPAARIYFWRGLDLLSIFFLTRFTRRPLRLFGGMGAAFGALGGALLVYLAIGRLFLDQSLSDRPLLVLGTLLLGLAVQAFTIGLLGELILFFHARSERDYRVEAVYETTADD